MKEILSALHLDCSTEILGNDKLASCFAVTDLAAASIGAVGCALSALIEDLDLSKNRSAVSVDARLASLWFAQSIQPIDWQMPPVWDAIAGDYPTMDGWIKLHTNLPHHRKAALSVLGTESVREKVAKEVLRWNADDLETAIVNAGGVAAAMRSRQAWSDHSQGQAVAAEPLIAWAQARAGSMRQWDARSEQPLRGLRVLDLTRVLAGPVATRTLAGFGADVLRIDPPGWDEANVVPDISLGKRCAFLQLDEPEDRRIFEDLLSTADVLVHGYRPNALAGLGYTDKTRQAIAPHLIEVCLDAYGWSGPWAARRGFDSLVQMSCGIADAGMRWANADRPTPLPVQALDHATGYLMAAAVIRALSDACSGRGFSNARLSLARTGHLLLEHRQSTPGLFSGQPEAGDFSPVHEQTPWGAARRLKPPLAVGDLTMRWELPAGELGTATPGWNR